MDESRAAKGDGPLGRAAPIVVVFFRNGNERRLSARIRDVGSQEQWIVPDARALHDLLARPPAAPEPESPSES
jgi:hypothetical protein